MIYDKVDTVNLYSKSDFKKENTYPTRNLKTHSQKYDDENN